MGQEVAMFRGTKGSKEFLTLEEKLTREVLELDAIETGGDDYVRATRKSAVEYAQTLLRSLDDGATE